MGHVEPLPHQEQKNRVYRLHEESRMLFEFLSRERELIRQDPSAQGRWLVMAEKLLDYNASLTDKADRIYDLLPARFDRRRDFNAPPVSKEFKAILEILESGCEIITRVNGKLRAIIIAGLPAEPEEISEDYWEILTKAVEQWQPKLTGSYYLHALIEVSVIANEIKWTARRAKKLLYEAQH